MTAPALDRPALLAGLVDAVREAGEAILHVRAQGFDVEAKADASPVTIADRRAEAVVLKALARFAPAVAVVAEEEVSEGRAPEVGERFFLVDALDGTREFVRGGDDFTVNVGLVEHGRPTLGVVYAPARRTLFVGDVADDKAWTQEADAAPAPLRVRGCAGAPLAVASRSHDVPATEAYLKAIGAEGRVSVGSSLKFGLVARGEADVYPRPSPTMEWDTAAGDAVLAAAGGRTLGLDGAPLAYGKPAFFNPGFVAVGGYGGAPPLGPFMQP